MYTEEIGEIKGGALLGYDRAILDVVLQKLPDNTSLWDLPEHSPHPRLSHPLNQTSTSVSLTSSMTVLCPMWRATSTPRSRTMEMVPLTCMAGGSTQETQGRTSFSPATTSSQASPVGCTPMSTTPSRAVSALVVGLHYGIIAGIVDTFMTTQVVWKTGTAIREGVLYQAVCIHCDNWDNALCLFVAAFCKCSQGGIG